VKVKIKNAGINQGLLAKATLFFSYFIWQSAFAETTNSVVNSPSVSPLPDPTGSLIRIFGAFVLVIGIFFGGVWFFKNWQRITIHRGRTPKLNVYETRSLGGRHAVYVVGYEQERFLIASSPNGVNLLSHLPAAAENEPETEAKSPQNPSFAEALKQVLKGK
jgi:flagellar biogenesis protein FliO